MGSPAAALRSLVGWIMVIGLAVYTVRHPDQVMQAVADLIEAVANWLATQRSTAVGEAGAWPASGLGGSPPARRHQHPHERWGRVESSEA